jgi:hypothetical protein
MRKSVRRELDEFFAYLEEPAQLVHHVSEQALAKARVKLSTTPIPAHRRRVLRFTVFLSSY